jgi:hypothetical protein
MLSIFWGLAQLLALLVFVGVLILLVRFLLVGTRAAQLYISRHSPAAPAGTATTAPSAAPSGTAATTTTRTAPATRPAASTTARTTKRTPKPPTTPAP